MDKYEKKEVRGVRRGVPGDLRGVRERFGPRSLKKQCEPYESENVDYTLGETSAFFNFRLLQKKKRRNLLTAKCREVLGGS